MRRLRIALTATVIVGALASSVAAQVEMSEERSMVLPAGKIFIQGFIELSLDDGAVLEPVSIAPDIWYGATPELSVGLIHSSRAAIGAFGGVGNGICVTGEDGGCAEVYDNIGVDGRYHFYRDGDITAAADAGLFLGPFDPATLSLKVGVVGQFKTGAFSVDLAPSIFFGLTERDGEMEGEVVVGSNKEIFFLPITAMYHVSPQLGIALQPLVVLPFEEIADTYEIGASIGVQYVMNKILIDAAFSLPALIIGGETEGATDVRTFTLGVGYAI